MYQNIIEKDKKTTVLLISTREKWHYLAVTKLSALFRNLQKIFIIWIVSIPLELKKKNLIFMKKFEEVCKNHKYCEEIVTKETR